MLLLSPITFAQDDQTERQTPNEYRLYKFDARCGVPMEFAAYIINSRTKGATIDSIQNHRDRPSQWDVPDSRTHRSAISKIVIIC